MGKTWTDAQTYCRNNYFDLATIRDTDDLQNLVNSAPSTYFGQAWIGLFDDVNSWHWSLSDSSFYSTGETSFRNWESGEPDNLGGQEYCAAMTPGGTWDSYSCQERLLFICFAENDPNRYIVISLARGWTEAQTYCRKFYTDLVSVRTKAENDKILQTVLANFVVPKLLWIGLFRDSWKWSDLEDSTFRNWDTWEPDNALLYEQCAAVYLLQVDSGGWADQLCDILLPFFCYE
ncbi:macrophage mannose receptor 1-like, partial [Scleropages formosus]